MPDVGPVLSTAPGEEPCPEMTSRAACAAVTEVVQRSPAPWAVVAKGDLTSTGSAEEHDAFLRCYGKAFGNEYRVYEGGVLQVHRRLLAPEALAWSERCRSMFGGLYAGYATGGLGYRCLAIHRRLVDSGSESAVLAGLRRYTGASTRLTCVFLRFIPGSPGAISTACGKPCGWPAKK